MELFYFFSGILFPEIGIIYFLELFYFFSGILFPEIGIIYFLNGNLTPPSSPLPNRIAD